MFACTLVEECMLPGSKRASPLAPRGAGGLALLGQGSASIHAHVLTSVFVFARVYECMLPGSKGLAPLPPGGQGG